MAFFNSETKLEELLLSENIIDIFPDGCVIFNSQWYIVKMNYQAEQIFLLPKNYMMSKPFWEIAPQYINTELYLALHQAKKGSSKVYCEINGSTSGRWFGVNIQSIGNFVVAFFKDITALKHTQSELIRSEERFSTAFRKSPALMTIISLKEGRYIAANDTFTKYTGYLANEIVGKTKKDISFLLSNNPQEIDWNFLNNIPVKELNVSYKTKTNEYRELLISSEKININGRQCLLEVGIDITDTVRYQKEIRHLQQLKLIGQMAAGIAHEIRNPLQTVKGFLQLLGTKKEISSYYSQFQLMINEIDRANQIISEFLSLSKTKSHQLKLSDINEIIKEVLPLIQAQAIKEDKNIKTFLNKVPKIWLDENEIKQVILNLTKNGLEAIQPKENVSITTKVDCNQVVLSVFDQGPGIPLAFKDKIGMPFFTTKSNGTGLGLAMCFSIVERHSAKMDYICDENGTTFFIHFPLVV